MGSLISNLRKNRFEMNLQFLLSLLVLAVNGAPKPQEPMDFGFVRPKPIPSQQIKILFPGGQMNGNGMVFDNYGNDITGNSGFGINGGFGNFGRKHGRRGPKPEGMCIGSGSSWC